MGELVFCVQSVSEVHPTDTAVGVDLNSKRFYIGRPVGSFGEIGEVELNLVPSLVQPHWHRADKWLYSGVGLIITGSKPPFHTFVVQNLNFKCEILLHVFNYHDKIRELDSQRFLWVCWASNIGSADIGPNYFQHQRLYVVVCYSFDVTISHLFVPYLKRFASDAVENRQQAGLKSILEHFYFTSLSMSIVGIPTIKAEDFDIN